MAPTNVKDFQKVLTQADEFIGSTAGHALAEARHLRLRGGRFRVDADRAPEQGEVLGWLTIEVQDGVIKAVEVHRKNTRGVLLATRTSVEHQRRTGGHSGFWWPWIEAGNLPSFKPMCLCLHADFLQDLPVLVLSPAEETLQARAQGRDPRRPPPPPNLAEGAAFESDSIDVEQDGMPADVRAKGPRTGVQVTPFPRKSAPPVVARDNVSISTRSNATTSTAGNGEGSSNLQAPTVTARDNGEGSSRNPPPPFNEFVCGKVLVRHEIIDEFRDDSENSDDRREYKLALMQSFQEEENRRLRAEAEMATAREASLQAEIRAELFRKRDLQREASEESQLAQARIASLEEALAQERIRNQEYELQNHEKPVQQDAQEQGRELARMTAEVARLHRLNDKLEIQVKAEAQEAARRIQELDQILTRKNAEVKRLSEDADQHRKLHKQMADVIEKLGERVLRLKRRTEQTNEIIAAQKDLAVEAIERATREEKLIELKEQLVEQCKQLVEQNEKLMQQNSKLLEQKDRVMEESDRVIEQKEKFIGAQLALITRLEDASEAGGKDANAEDEELVRRARELSRVPVAVPGEASNTLAIGQANTGDESSEGAAVQANRTRKRRHTEEDAGANKRPRQ